MDAPLSDDELQMMQQEITLTKEMTGLDGNTQARKILQDGVVSAARSVVGLALHADKESVRFQAAVYVLERNLGRLQDNPPAPVEDPYMDIVNACVERFNPQNPDDAVNPDDMQPPAPTEADQAMCILQDALPGIYLDDAN